MKELKTFLQLKHVDKTFQVNNQSVPVLAPTDLHINKGEFVCIVGPSGCGKSTLLRMIAGLETSDSGSIELEGKTITNAGLDRGMAFQEDRLFPWLTIEQNIAFGLGKDVSKVEKDRLVQEHLQLVKLEQFSKAYPHQLSGGMKQRASIARALVNQPSVLLLDEPFGALDAMTRVHMQQEITRIWEKEKITMILVTHDISEAVYLADRIVVLTGRPGGIKEIIPVNLERPRHRNSFQFIEIQEKIYSEFFEEEDIRVSI